MSWPLLRHSPFSSSYFLQSLVLASLSVSPSPLRHSATRSKFAFVLLRFSVQSHVPGYNLQTPVRGIEAGAEAHAHPESSPSTSPPERCLQALLPPGRALQTYHPLERTLLECFYGPAVPSTLPSP